MTFVNPGFLWALFAVSIPLLVHLLNFRPYKTIFFSNLNFLQQIDKESHSRRKLKEYIILLLRMLAIAALVIAFSQPVKKKYHSSAICKDKIVLYIDNSFSMNLEGAAGNNLEIAKKKAYEIVKAFPLDNRFIVLTNDFSPSQFRTYNSQQVRDIIAKITVSSHKRSLSDIVAKLKNILSNDTSCKYYVFILSDFQKTSTDLDLVNFPVNWQIYFIPFIPIAPHNIAVDSVFFAKPHHLLGTKDSLVAVIHNYSKQFINNMRVELWINDSLKGFENISIPPGQLQQASFSFIASHSGWNRGFIRINDLPVDFDNSLFFSFLVKKNFKVLLISTKKNEFLSNLYSYQMFNLENVNPQNIHYSNLKNNDIIVINELNDLSSGIISYLKDFVSEGGNLVIIPSLENYFAANTLLEALGLNKFLYIDENKTRLWNINLNDPLYKGTILSYEKNDLMPTIDKHLVRKVDYAKEEVLLSAQNGDILLSRMVMGKGQIYVFAFPMISSITDFVTSPIFVVTMVNIGIQATVASQLYYIIGRDEVIDIPNIESEFFMLKKDGYTLIPDLRFFSNHILLNLSHLPLENGIYNLVDQRDSLIKTIAFNYSRLESVMDFYSIGELKNIISNRHLDNVKIITNVLDDLSVSISQDLEENNLWKVFVILAIIFLILEVVVNRLIK